MGNEITKKYDMVNHHTGLGGNNSLWKVYPAKTKNNGQSVSLFVFRKDEMLKHVTSKLEKEHIVKIIRKDLRVLKDLSHPGVIKIIHIFDESKKVLAFVSEPIQCTLADLLVIQRPMLNPAASGMVAASNLQLSEPEKARGLAQVFDGLQYLHQVARRLHCGLSSETIFLSPTGEWKIGGFGFSLELGPNSYGVENPFFQGGQAQSVSGVRMDPWLRYSAPEMTSGPVGSHSNLLSPKVDIFSLGCIMHEVYTKSTEAFIPLRDETPFSHRNFFAGGAQPVLDGTVPSDVANLICLLVAGKPEDRPEISSVLSSPSFHTQEVTILRTLDHLTSMDISRQATFLSNLLKKLESFSFRIQKGTVLPCIFRAGHKNPQLWSYIFPTVFQISKQLSKTEFQECVQPALKLPLTIALDQPSVCQLTPHITYLFENVESEFFVGVIVPFIIKNLDSQQQQILELTLKHLASKPLVSAIPPDVREGTLVTTICKLSVKGAAVQVRVAALLALAKTFELYGNQMLMERIFPTLRFCTEKPGAPPAVLMCCLGCYDAICKTASVDRIARYILPGIVPLLAAKELDAKQFNMVKTVAQSLLVQVVESRQLDYGSSGVPLANSTGIPETAYAIPETPLPPKIVSSQATVEKSFEQSPFNDVQDLTKLSTQKQPERSLKLPMHQESPLESWNPPASNLDPAPVQKTTPSQAFHNSNLGPLSCSDFQNFTGLSSEMQSTGNPAFPDQQIGVPPAESNLQSSNIDLFAGLQMPLAVPAEDKQGGQSSYQTDQMAGAYQPPIPPTQPQMNTAFLSPHQMNSSVMNQYSTSNQQQLGFETKTHQSQSSISDAFSFLDMEK